VASLAITAAIFNLYKMSESSKNLTRVVAGANTIVEWILATPFELVRNEFPDGHLIAGSLVPGTANIPKLEYEIEDGGGDGQGSHREERNAYEDFKKRHAPAAGSISSSRQ